MSVGISASQPLLPHPTIVPLACLAMNQSSPESMLTKPMPVGPPAPPVWIQPHVSTRPLELSAANADLVDAMWTKSVAVGRGLVWMAFPTLAKWLPPSSP